MISSAHTMTGNDIHEYLDDILPLGVPTYVREVLSVGPHPDVEEGVEATVKLFDGGLMLFRCNGPLGEGQLRFAFPTGDVPFHWHKEMWERLPTFSEDDQILFLRSVDRLFERLV